MKAGDQGPGTGRHGLLGRGEQKEIEEQESPSSGHLNLRTALEISVKQICFGNAVLRRNGLDGDHRETVGVGWGRAALFY